MVQEEDVLDTWFSSWLFPFATLGWPEEDPETQADLEYFHPTDVLVSGYDILFFWIARMIMASFYFTGQVPYRDIFITGMIKDKLGRWMSKSLGNGIDPLELIEEYGTDAVRFYLTILCAQGQDIRLDPAGLAFRWDGIFPTRSGMRLMYLGGLLNLGKNISAPDQSESLS